MHRWICSWSKISPAPQSVSLSLCFAVCLSFFAFFRCNRTSFCNFRSFVAIHLLHCLANGQHQNKNQNQVYCQVGFQIWGICWFLGCITITSITIYRWIKSAASPEVGRENRKIDNEIWKKKKKMYIMICKWKSCSVSKHQKSSIHMCLPNSEALL